MLRGQKWLNYIISWAKSELIGSWGVKRQFLKISHAKLQRNSRQCNWSFLQFLGFLIEAKKNGTKWIQTHKSKTYNVTFIKTNPAWIRLSFNGLSSVEATETFSRMQHQYCCNKLTYCSYLLYHTLLLGMVSKHTHGITIIQQTKAKGKAKSNKSFNNSNKFKKKWKNSTSKKSNLLCKTKHGRPWLT